MTYRAFRVDPRIRAAFYLLSSLALLVSAQGCAALGVAAHAIPVTIKPAYTGLKGQSVAVMVWADRPIRIDFPKVSLDLSNYVQSTIAKSVGLDETKEYLLGTTFPYEPRSVVRYQHDHPDMEGASITEIAPKLGVTRLIYIELEELQTRSNSAVELYRGSATATLQVIEINNGQAKVVYNENNLTCVFPRHVPEEGIPNAGDYKIYVGTLQYLSDEITKRFLPHPEDDDG